MIAENKATINYLFDISHQQKKFLNLNAFANSNIQNVYRFSFSPVFNFASHFFFVPLRVSFVLLHCLGIFTTKVHKVFS
jgi:hypothetical protein